MDAKACASMAKANRDGYVAGFIQEVWAGLEEMAKAGEFFIDLDVSDYPVDVLRLVGQELHRLDYQYSLVKFEGEKDKDKTTLHVSIEHMI